MTGTLTGYACCSTDRQDLTAQRGDAFAAIGRGARHEFMASPCTGRTGHGRAKIICALAGSSTVPVACPGQYLHIICRTMAAPQGEVRHKKEVAET